ncbi:MAG: carboxypeptidase regulatory-like domain-containing protein [Bryobacteraceae bacterium]
MKIATLILIAVACALAQNTTASLSGTVHDEAGAVVPKARVSITSQSTGFVRTLESNREGFFSFPDLTPATYELKVEAAGFRSYHKTGIEISASDHLSERVALSIGQVSESVTVSAEAATVNTVSGERSGTLTSDQLEQLALRGRDVFDAVGLMAGVVDTTDGRDAPGPTSVGGIYIMGGRNDAKNVTINGVTILDTGSNGSIHSMPSMDSVAEVKVLMSAYSAENGRNPSAISIITKGGSRQFHGSAGFYLRNEVLNANDFFNNKAGRDRTAYRYDIGNYTLSGPLLIPKINKDRSRLFFHFSQEFQKQMVQFGTRLITVPTALERAGNFSDSRQTNGSLWTVNDPLAGKTLFPGRIIPPSRLTATGRNILNLFPLPNYTAPDAVNRYQYNYFVSEAAPYPRRTETIRVDYSPRANWQMYGSFSNNADKQETLYGIWVDGSLNYPITPIVFQQPGRTASVSSTNTISPTMFNQATVAFSRNTLTFFPKDNDKVDRTKLGIDIAQRDASLNPLNLIPNMTFGGIANAANPSLNNGTPYFNQNTILSFMDNVTKISGTHTVKFGIYFEHTQKIQSASTPTRGTLSFSADGNNPLDSNNAYANALLGNYDTYQEATGRPVGNFLFTNTEFFLQDTWRVRKTFSLDYGVRFYVDPPQYDGNGQLASFAAAAFDPAKTVLLLRPATVDGKKVALDPLTGATYGQGLIGAFAPGHGDAANGNLVGGKSGVPLGLYDVSPLAVAPRFGFAWDPFGTGRTAIRGGGGVYYDRIQGNPVMGQIANPPTVYSPTQYYGTFADIRATAVAGFLAPSGSVTSLATPGHQQSTYNYNLGIQRQIRSSLVEIGYAGSLGRHQLWQRNVNPVPLGANFLNLHPENRDPTTTNSVLPPNFLRPYQGFGDIMLYEFANSSNYNSLQVTFRQRFGRSFNLSANYTFSKALDSSDSYSQAVDPAFPARSRNYGPAGFDRTQVFNTNFYWTLPKISRNAAPPARWVLNNWIISAVLRFNTGAPFTPGYSNLNGLATPTGSASVTARVQVTDPSAPIERRFLPPPQPAGQGSAFWSTNSTGPQAGNLGKNTMRGPGTANADLSLYRELRFSERLKGQLRLEGYNAINHTQFSSVDTTLRFNNVTGEMYNTLFNQPTAARPSRRVQIAMRLNF